MIVGNAVAQYLMGIAVVETSVEITLIYLAEPMLCPRG